MHYNPHVFCCMSMLCFMAGACLVFLVCPLWAAFVDHLLCWLYSLLSPCFLLPLHATTCLCAMSSFRLFYAIAGNCAWPPFFMHSCSVGFVLVVCYRNALCAHTFCCYFVHSITLLVVHVVDCCFCCFAELSRGWLFLGC